jgi:hypothetical protein
MKTLFCLILLAPTVLLRAGEIDQLQTQRDVERFVRKIEKAYRKEDIFGNRMDSARCGIIFSNWTSTVTE